MRINHNIASLNTYNQLTNNTNATSKSLEKLSSGLRINRAGDDAAGLAISEKMRGQIRGLDQASSNAQDGISLIQTAEGALSETQSILQRMRELSVQASNDTATDSDREEIAKEISQLKDEIDRISNDTEFNTKKLLNGSVGSTANVVGTDGLELGTVKVVDSDLVADTYTVAASAATLGVDINTNTTGLSTANFTLDSASIAGLKLGDYTLEVKSASGSTFDVTLKNSDGVEVASLSAWDASSGDGTLTGQLPDGTSTTFTIASTTALTEGEMTFNLNATYAADTFSVTNSAGATTYSNASALKITTSEYEAGGMKFSMDVGTALTDSSSDIAVTNNSLTMHIGANQNQTMKVGIGDMDTTSLGIADIDVTTQTGAENAITAIDDAIKSVSAERAKLGAYQNRLEHTINNLGTSSENLTSAESRIRDVDMAAEMMEYTKNSILTQAAQSMLAQANQQPQGVLKLLS